MFCLNGSGAFTFKFWVTVRSLFHLPFRTPDLDSGMIITMDENHAAYAIQPYLAPSQELRGGVYCNGPGGMAILANPIPTASCDKVASHAVLLGPKGTLRGSNRAMHACRRVAAATLPWRPATFRKQRCFLDVFARSA